MKLKTRPPESEIPTSSMADIAFLLIIFFMVTAVFASTKGLEFRLPTDEEDTNQAEDIEAVFIKIEPSGDFTVDCKPMEPEGILDYLAPKLERDPNKPVIIYSDPYAPYQAMITVYDVLVSAESRDDLPFKEVKNIVVPTSSDVEEYINIFGSNPFEGRCG